MNGIINLLKTSYRINKRLFIVVVLVIAAFLLIGCSSSAGSAPAPSGPIGGGCG